MKIDTNMKKMIILIFIAASAYLIVDNFNIIINIIFKVYRVLFPFILGGMIAFVLNIPSSKIEKWLLKETKCKKKLARSISIILSLVLLTAIISFVSFLLMPELIENIRLLLSNIPSLIAKFQVFCLDLLDKYPDVQVQINEFFKNQDSLGSIVSNSLNYVVNGSISFVTKLVTGFFTVFTALVFAIYMLSQKEYLGKCSKKFICAIFDKKKSKEIFRIANVSNSIFSNFISGQCVEAVILGSIIFVAALIFRFPYALLIGVLTAFTALIPIFGAIFAMVVGAILIGINDPMQALIFIVVYQVIQQIEGNLIYPKVVGKCVGLSPLWTLLAIIVGGDLFGIPGMILGLPTASVIYILVKDKINELLNNKKIKI